ncbi:MAG: hypothetical protein Kow00122_16170 [Thermoleophilia bacterium]
MSVTSTEKPGGRRVRVGDVMGLGVGLLAGAAVGYLVRSETAAPSRARCAATSRETGPGLPPDLDLERYEYCSRVIWSNDPRKRRGDLEDAEEIEGLVNDDWELVDVIVPFAGIRQLELAYPGNTTKLIAYFRRPVRGRDHDADQNGA